MPFNSKEGWLKGYPLCVFFLDRGLYSLCLSKVKLKNKNKTKLTTGASAHTTSHTKENIRNCYRICHNIDHVVHLKEERAPAFHLLALWKLNDPETRQLELPPTVMQVVPEGLAVLVGCGPTYSCLLTDLQITLRAFLIN